MSGPFKPIPDKTQAHVDRVVGLRLGEHEVVERVAEGRYGTIYRCRNTATDKPATLQVLRVGTTPHDEEVRAANAIKSSGIAVATGFGEVPDGRRYRLLEHLDGESLQQVLDREKRLPPQRVVEILDQVAAVLQACHAWAIAHGSLGPSSVFVVGGGVKLIDFGLAKKSEASLEKDLEALGALGVALLTGKELDEGAPAPRGDRPIDRLVRELVEKRVPDATALRRTLDGLKEHAPAPRRSRRAPVVVGLLLALAGGAGYFAWQRSAQAPAADTAADDALVAALDEAQDTADEPPVDEAPTAEPAVIEPEPDVATPDAAPRPQRRVVKRPARPPPSAGELMSAINALERKLRAQARRGEDLDQALFVLNKQRLRLTGNPTVADRRDVVKQLIGWRRSYLRR